jgi:hypothetical protein
MFLELRENAVKALDDRSWDPVTLVVKDRQDLCSWVKWLDMCGTQHSAILTGMRGWLIVFEVCTVLKLNLRKAADADARTGSRWP